MKERNRRPCVIDRCSGRAHSALGYCGKHHKRWKLYGDPLASKDFAYRYVNHGYVYLYRPDHPLTVSRTGTVAEHRVVLYDRIGPGEHACHWCGRTVSWDKRWPRDHDALVPDHLNGTKDDNRTENLVPSCQPCNISRAQTALQASRRDDVPLVGDT